MISYQPRRRAPFFSLQLPCLSPTPAPGSRTTPTPPPPASPTAPPPVLLRNKMSARERGHGLERNRSCSSEHSIESRLSSSTGQLIVVANRLPVSIAPDPTQEGGYRFAVSSGGLASALSGCKKKMDFVVSAPCSSPGPPRERPHADVVLPGRSGSVGQVSLAAVRGRNAREQR